jgi:hypothetical protein
MLSRQPNLRPKSHIAGFPDALYDFSTVSPLSQLESRIASSEEKHDQRVFRVKRKHVLKACDRCRVKKTKVSRLLFCYPGAFMLAILTLHSAMGNNPAIVAHLITTPVYSEKEKLLRQRSTLKG